MSFDNFGESTHPGSYNWGDNFVWGYDEISWFSLCDDEYARYWLEYAVNYMNRVDPIGYYQMPGVPCVDIRPRALLPLQYAERSYPDGALDRGDD